MPHRPIGKSAQGWTWAAIGALAFAAPLIASSWTSQTRPEPDPRLRALAQASLATIGGELKVAGLGSRVEVIRDTWGVPHIYAQSTVDLFFAQGYVMAQDRLWQMDQWRREREGRMAEILGPQAVERDRQARLLKYRGPMDDREWTSYHPEGRRIFEAYAQGVNAFIRERSGNLPVEFKVTGLKPELWTAETVVLRNASFGDAQAELTLARNVVRLGAAEANKQRAPDPWDELAVPEGLDLSIIDANVTTGGRGGAGRGAALEILQPYRSWIGGVGAGLPAAAALTSSAPADPPGSNNWVVSGRLSVTGKPVVVNDPHRTVTHPSLRYISHLVAPGWNVIGASELPFIGVAIGHNDRLGWGLTIVGTDQEDVYVEEVNPANANEVRFRGIWEPLRIVREEIVVKGQVPQVVELKFSRHGPVFFEDGARHRAYVLKSALLEPGTAPYLGGLRLAQAKDCREFLDAAMYWKAPSENLICGDVDGNIAWQASALTPNRNASGPTQRSWMGRLPVPGTGAYEWNGFRTDLPREFNPARGFIATANNNIHPPAYATPVMFKSATNVPFDRITRLLQMLSPQGRYTIDDHRRMQLDNLQLRALSETALFRNWSAQAPRVERGRQLLASWDGRLTRESAAAALHDVWRGISTAPERDQATPLKERAALHETSLARAVDELTKAQGDDWTTWRWGRLHTRAFPFSLLTPYSLPTVERPGGAGTVAADGATYREIMDVADWDRSIVTSVPGQSAQPESPFFSNLHRLWADDVYFPMVFSRARVEAAAAHRLVLR